MGRSIPSFRQLIEIEKFVWSEYKKELETKKEKKPFDTLFDNTELNTTKLSFANRSLAIEPIIIGRMLHHYKTLVEMSNLDLRSITGKDIITSEIYRPYSRGI